MGYVILLAVMIASLLELRIRNALKQEKAAISSGSRKKIKRPTARLLLNMLNRILVVYLGVAEQPDISNTKPRFDWEIAI